MCLSVCLCLSIVPPVLIGWLFVWYWVCALFVGASTNCNRPRTDEKEKDAWPEAIAKRLMATARKRWRQRYANGYANGTPTGYANDYVNGCTNGCTNGYANGYTNGTPTATPMALSTANGCDGCTNGYTNDLRLRKRHANGCPNGCAKSTPTAHQWYANGTHYFPLRKGHFSHRGRGSAVSTSVFVCGTSNSLCRLACARGPRLLG